MECVYRWSFCVCICESEATMHLFFIVWGPEEQDTNIHTEIASGSLRVYRLQTVSLNITMPKNWCSCANSLGGPSNWSLLTSAFPSPLHIFFASVVFVFIYYAVTVSWKKNKWGGGNYGFQIAGKKILNRHIKIFQMSSSTFSHFRCCNLPFLLDSCSKKGKKKWHRSIKTPFVRAVTPVQTTSFIPRLEDGHFNWVPLLWLCRPAKWETEWQGPDQKDFGLSECVCVCVRACINSPTACPCCHSPTFLPHWDVKLWHLFLSPETKTKQIKCINFNGPWPLWGLYGVKRPYLHSRRY